MPRRRAISTERTPLVFSALTSAARARAVGFRSLVFPLGFRTGDALAGPFRAVSADCARAQIETLGR
jgi:hypothetical protein